VRRELFEKIVKKLYPDQNINVANYTILEKNKYEDGEWVLDRPAVFVEIKCDDFNDKGLNLSDFLTSFTGFEFSISKI
jgi:hypothetical protein